MRAHMHKQGGSESLTTTHGVQGWFSNSGKLGHADSVSIFSLTCWGGQLLCNPLPLAMESVGVWALGI